MARPLPLPVTVSDCNPIDLTSVSTVCEADDQACWATLSSVLHDADCNDAQEIHIESEPDCLRLRFRSAFELIEHRVEERKAYDDAMSLLKTHLWSDNENTNNIRGWFLFAVHSENTLFQLDVCRGSFGESYLFTQLNDSKLPPSKLEDIGLGRHQIVKIKTALEAKQGLIVIASDVVQARRRTARAMTQHLVSPDKKIIVAEPLIHPFLPRTIQMGMDFPASVNQNHDWQSLSQLGADVITTTQTLDIEYARNVVNIACEQTLVVTGIACSSASEALGKLLGLGVRSETLAHCLNTIVTQHRVRCLCPYCRHTISPDDAATAWLATHSPMHAGNVNDWLRNRMRSSFSDAPGCDKCNQTGFRSWLDIFDVLTVGDELRDTLYDSDYQYAFAQLAQQSTLSTSLLRLAQEGIISLHEAIRVMGLPFPGNESTQPRH